METCQFLTARQVQDEGMDSHFDYALKID